MEKDVPAITQAWPSFTHDRLRLDRLRQGDEETIALLVDTHRDRLVRVATNLLRDRNEAEDVAQEAFLKGFREAHKLRDDRALGGYLYTITVRLCMDRLRAKRPEVIPFDRAQEDKGAEVENRVVIQKLLARLPYDLRTTLILREIEQLSYEEIAEMLQVPVGTIRSRLHAAREKFRRLWVETVGSER